MSNRKRPAPRRGKSLPTIDPGRLVPLPRIPIYSCSASPFEDIPELPIEIVPPATLKHLAKLDGKTLEAVAEIVIAILDRQAGDEDLELDDHDEENGDREDDRDSDNAVDWRMSPYGEISVENEDDEDDDPHEHDDDDTDAAYEDIPTKGWLWTPSGTATVAEFQKAIGDGGPGDPEDAQVEEDQDLSLGNCGAPDCQPVTDLVRRADR